MRKGEASEDGGHEGIGATLFEEAVDPELKTAVKCELCAKDFVLAEDEEEDADADAQNGQRTCIDVIVGAFGGDGLGHWRRTSGDL